jgi:ribA/ribD-fused uncharacterized protein
MIENEICFYRACGPYGYLSNLYPAPVIFEGRSFRCSEEAYQFGKPNKKEVAEWLVSAPKPHLCAMAAHGLLVFDIVEDWNIKKVDRMKRVLLAKFDQNPTLAGYLLSTGSKILIEESKTDAFWGIGKKGNGQNMLGKLLMEIREEIS